MPVYEYKALDAKGKRISGILDAESPPAARQKLRASQIFPISIDPVAQAPGKTFDRVSTFLSAPFSGIRTADIAVTTRGLATLLGAGFPLVEALEPLVSQTKAAALKKTLIRIKVLVVEGNSFASALSQFPGTFPSLYINMVRAGEASGTLEIVLERLAEMMENQLDLTGRIKSALTYPIFMALLGTAVLFFLMTVIVPNIATVFSEMGRILPAPTRLLIAASDLFQTFWWLILLMGLGGIVLTMRAGNTPKGREFFDGMILKFPVIGFLVTRLATARLSRTLGSLLENGIPLLQALDIVKNVAGYVPIAKAIHAATEEVGKGRGMAEALAEYPVFPSLFLQMLKVGEQSGRLEEMLQKISVIYEKEATAQVTRITALLEPVMILIMGILVGGIVLSICLPIFEMNQLVF